MAHSILVVDDIPQNIEAFCNILKSCFPNLQTITAGGGKEALEKVVEHVPDMILLDVHMPEMDGFEVCRKLKASPATANIPVLMVSAYLTKGTHRALGLDVGADGYLCKPFDTTEFIAQVRSLIRLKTNEDLLRNHQNRLEEELEQRTRHLRASEAHWRNLFECSPDAILIQDYDGNVQEANPAACDMYAMTHEELVGRNMLELVPPKLRPEMAERINQWRHDGQHTYQGVCFSSKGEEMPVEIRAKHFKYHGTPALLLHLRDVSERVKMEHNLVQAQKLESLGILAGGIAHDFNNILTGIIGNISVAKLDMKHKEPEYNAILAAEKSAVRAQLLTQQLLTFSKGGAPVRKTSSVSHLIKDTTTFVMCGSRSSCQFDIEDDLWPADIDVGQISQVIENLIINAIQAMPHGGTIFLTARNLEIDEYAAITISQKLKPGRYIEIVVRDEGVGIPKDDLPQIFDPYFSTKVGGSGLGLASVYSIIQKHDGVISVDSEVDEGATFTVLIPASDSHLTEEPVLDETPIMGEGRILVMDDEFVIRDILDAALERLGYQSVTVPDGQAAIEAYQKAMSKGEPFDAVILDITVPGGMGGEETVARLRSIDPNVKAIVSSGYSTDGIMSLPEARGFNGVLAKPYSIQELSVELHDVLNPEKSQ